MGEHRSRRNFIKNTAGAALGLNYFFPATAWGEPAPVATGDAKILQQWEQTLKAGFAEADITPDIGMEQPGGYGKAFHQKLHDPCKVRAAVFSEGAKCVALIGIDALAVPRSLVEKARKGIQARCGIPPEAVMIGASHSHSSGPTSMVQPGEYDHADPFVQSLAYEKSSCADPKYLERVEKQLVEAVCEAYQSSEPLNLGIGRGKEEKAAFNRRFFMKNGLTFTHPGQLNPDIIKPAGPIDPEVGVIGAWNKEGRCVGCIVNYACHATTNPGGISANWVYYMEQTIRGAMGNDCTVVFLQGASGDVTQVDNRNPHANRQGEDWARFVGGRVGAEAVRVLLDMPRGVLTPIDVKTKTLSIKRRVPGAERVKKSYELVKQDPAKVGATTWTFAKEIVLLDAKIKKEPVVQAEVQAIQVGPAVFVSNPAEFFCQLGLDIKSGSPFPFTFPVELANDCVGYVPTKEAFDANGGGYETRLTSYSNLDIHAGPMMVEAGLALTRQMNPGKAPEWAGAPAFKAVPWGYGDVGPELQ